MHSLNRACAALQGVIMDKNSTIITSSQLERIRAQVNAPTRVDLLAQRLIRAPLTLVHTALQASQKLTDTQKQDELLWRKELSDARAAKWTNTLQVRLVCRRAPLGAWAQKGKLVCRALACSNRR